MRIWNMKYWNGYEMTFPLCILLRLNYWPCKYRNFSRSPYKRHTLIQEGWHLKRNNVLMYLGLLGVIFLPPYPSEIVVWHGGFSGLVLPGVFVLKSYWALKMLKKNRAFRNSVRITWLYNSWVCSSPGSITVGAQLAAVGGGFGSWLSSFASWSSYGLVLGLLCCTSSYREEKIFT